MTKDEARREAIRRWLLLPPYQRETYSDAEAYAERLEAELDFHTITNRQKLIAAWLILELDREYLAAEDAARDERRAADHAKAA
jgi:hypothetical protein